MRGRLDQGMRADSDGRRLGVETSIMVPVCSGEPMRVEPVGYREKRLELKSSTPNLHCDDDQECWDGHARDRPQKCPDLPSPIDFGPLKIAQYCSRTA